MNFRLHRVLIVLYTLLFLFNFDSFSQTDSTINDESSFKAKADSFNAFMENAIIYIPVPIFSISKETGMLFGLTKFNDFRIGVSPNGKDTVITQPSTVSGLIYLTEKHQFKINVQSDLMMKQNKHNIKSRITYFSFPLLYYGIGNDTEKKNASTVLFENVEFAGSYRYQLKNNFFAGLSYKYSNAINVQYRDSSENTEIINNYDVTQNEGVTSGFGFIFTHEGRDNRLNAYKGDYVNIELNHYRNWTGSNFEYDRLLIDVRKYFTLVDSNRLILATQFVGEFIGNGANIQNIPALGGPKGLRGIYYGRFRDNKSLALKAELRFPLFWIIGGTAFGGMAQVAPSMGQLAFDRNHYTYGGGLRLMISSKNRVNLRLDFGRSKDDNTFVLGFSEAF